MPAHRLHGFRVAVALPERPAVAARVLAYHALRPDPDGPSPPDWTLDLAAPRPAVRHRGGHRVGHVGVVGRLAVAGAEVECVEAAGLQRRLERALQLDPGVVRGEGDGLGWHRWRPGPCRMMALLWASDPVAPRACPSRPRP